MDARRVIGDGALEDGQCCLPHGLQKSAHPVGICHRTGQVHADVVVALAGY
jgi:hypothetical protein